MLLFWAIIVNKCPYVLKYQKNSIICCEPIKRPCQGIYDSRLCGREEITRIMLSVFLPSNYACVSQANPQYALPHTSPHWVTHHPVLCIAVSSSKEKPSGYHRFFGLQCFSLKLIFNPGLFRN